jgi:hypothetical protein
LRPFHVDFTALECIKDQQDWEGVPVFCRAFLFEVFIMIPVLLLLTLAAGSVLAQDISSGTSTLVTENSAIVTVSGPVDQPFAPSSPLQPAGPSQPAPPSLIITILSPQQPYHPFQPGLPGSPGGPASPADPQHPIRSPLVPVSDPSLVTANTMSIRVPGQLQNVSASINTLIRNLSSGGQ